MTILVTYNILSNISSTDGHLQGQCRAQLDGAGGRGGAPTQRGTRETRGAHPKGERWDLWRI